jgi:hypothetical protein
LVSVVDSEKKRSDEYWMGVRDALRMVDSFTKWARRNEGRAKSLDDFIHDGLVAAAKRCESCLKDDLGLTFAEEEQAKGESTEVGSVPSGYEMDSITRDSSDIETSFEVTPEDMSPGASEVPIESESDAISIDSVGRLDDEEMEDITIEGPPREFTSDFELVEPTELDVETTEEPVEEVEPEPELVGTEVTKEEDKPSFTWSDYEKAVAPSPEVPEVDEEEAELPPPIEFEPPVTAEPELDLAPESVTSEVPEPPPIIPDEFESPPVEEDTSEMTEDAEPITEPPAPPPPPESDEDEEERRRRARRLFFGD